MQIPSAMELDSAQQLSDVAAPLANFVCRRLRYYEAIGGLRPGDVDVRDLVARTYREAADPRRHRPTGERDYRWLRSIAETLVQREVRRFEAERPPARPEILPLRELVADPTVPVPEPVAHDPRLQRALALLIGQLPDMMREPFLQVVVDGYSLEDAAALEGLRPDGIIRRVAQASLWLRDRLAREYGDTQRLALEQIFRAVEKLA
jgi:DNA-directed RNA polymerase specialized sigma24 family protein